MIPRILPLALALAAMLVASAAGAESFTMGKLSKAQSQTLIESASDPEALSRGMRQAVPEFKVSAVSEIICVIGFDGIECDLGSETKRCPEKVKLKVEGQKNSVEVPVDCVGPDENGECECEFAGN